MIMQDSQEGFSTTSEGVAAVESGSLGLKNNDQIVTRA
jgi:hypothetical protein